MTNCRLTQLKGVSFSCEEIETRLRNEGYLIERKLSRQVWAAVNANPVGGAFLFGQAGVGKTFLPEMLAKVLGLVPGERYFFYQCFPGTREDDLIAKILPAEDTVSGVRLHEGVVLQAARSSLQDLTMLVLDEWDKARPSADSFLLDFLQNGRINYNGWRITADLSRLVVFITSNDEREISEPLLRRLPKIDFQPLSPTLVAQALERSHPKNPYIPHVVQLYCRCLAADLPKPATVQELRQLLDAISLLGGDADWDELVYQFVTKTVESHTLLKRAEEMELEYETPSRVRLDAQAYTENIMVDEEDEIEPEMPYLAQRFDLDFETGEEFPESERVAGILERTEGTYDSLGDYAGIPESPDFRESELARVVGDKIVLLRPIELRDALSFPGLWEGEGELLLVEPLASLEQVQGLRRLGLKAIRWGKQEILLKHPNEQAYARWTPEHGLEIIVKTEAKRLVEDIKNSSEFWKDDVGRASRDLKWAREALQHPEKLGDLWRKAEAQLFERAREEEEKGASSKDSLEGEVRFQIPLPGTDLYAIITTKRLGQQSPEEGDGVVVEGILYLPAEDGYLHPDLRFGSRVGILNTRLYNSWGINAGKWRRMKVQFSGEKWSPLEQKAALSLVEELQPLLEALEERQAALLRAEGGEE